jgi:hypothetical protein
MVCTTAQNAWKGLKIRHPQNRIRAPVPRFMTDNFYPANIKSAKNRRFKGLFGLFDISFAVIRRSDCSKSLVRQGFLIVIHT